MRVLCWADGSGIATGGPGGWAFVLVAVDGHGQVVRQVEDSGPLDECTNQVAELQAILQGLRALVRPCKVDVYSDSEYALDGFRKSWVERWKSNGWLNREGDPVANRGLWEALAFEVDRHEVSWHHVPGHALEWLCGACGWVGLEPHRKTPRARIRLCPDCMAKGVEVPCQSRDRFPLNARCDELAGIQRRRVVELQNSHTEGAAATTTVEARGTAQPTAGCREHNRRGDLGRATGAPLTGQRQDGLSQGPATEQDPRVAHGGAGQLPPPIEVTLNEALRSIGHGYRAFKQAFGAKVEPSTLSARPDTWRLCDRLALSCYGASLVEVIGRQWWPKAERVPARVEDLRAPERGFVVA